MKPISTDEIIKIIKSASEKTINSDLSKNSLNNNNNIKSIEDNELNNDSIEYLKKMIEIILLSVIKVLLNFSNLLLKHISVMQKQIGI